VIYIAHKTLAAIQQGIECDQGAHFRTLLREAMPLAEDIYRGKESPFRTHIGASRIGTACARELWYEFHWAVEPKHGARILRLFNRGHMEEPRFVAMLQAAGIEIHQYQPSGKQYQITMHGGNFGGSLDGVATKIPDTECPALCEFKTHDRKSFTKLAGQNWNEYLTSPETSQFTGEGVRASKFQHYVQMQMYMRAYRLTTGLYLAVCKDDDSLYGELISLDESISDAFSNRARDIIFSTEPPSRIKNDPSWWQCKCCKQASVCYGKAAPARNCRTCAHSMALPKEVDGALWACRKHESVLDKQAQLTGCSQYEVRKL
jgi:hypothetical protein